MVLDIGFAISRRSKKENILGEPSGIAVTARCSMFIKKTFRTKRSLK
jgi:hypothetical protein